MNDSTYLFAETNSISNGDFHNSTQLVNTNLSQIGQNITTIATTTNNDGYSTVEDLSSQCIFEQPPLTDVRFWIVTVFGTTVSFVSIVENSFLFFLFSTRKHHRTTYNMYMMFLTFFDIFVSGAYVLLMFHYMVPILTVSHCGITSSTFLILAATFERYCLSDKQQWVQFVQRHRKFILLSAILLGIISKGTICFEFKILHVEECTGTMMEFQLQFQDFVYGTPYHTVWRFWYRNFVTVFFPFFALLALNICIVRTLAQAERQSLSVTSTNLKQFKRKKVARSATRATVLVVFTYLFSNIINVVLTTWEHIDKSLLVTDYVQAYAIALDLASLLTNLASAFRPPIYLICQPTLRQEVFAILKRIFATRKEKNLGAYNTQIVTDILYSQEDENFNNNCANGNNVCKEAPPLLPKPKTVIHTPETAISDMDLLKDEADFLEDQEDHDDYLVKLMGVCGGKLETMAAKMRLRKMNSLTANSRLAAMIIPSCTNAMPCLAPVFDTNNNNYNSENETIYNNVIDIFKEFLPTSSSSSASTSAINAKRNGNSIINDDSIYQLCQSIKDLSPTPTITISDNRKVRCNTSETSRNSSLKSTPSKNTVVFLNHNAANNNPVSPFELATTLQSLLLSSNQTTTTIATTEPETITIPATSTTKYAQDDNIKNYFLQTNNKETLL